MGLFPKRLTEFFFLFSLLIFTYFFKYETIVRSSAWSFGHSDPDRVAKTKLLCQSNVNRKLLLHWYIFLYIHLQLISHISDLFGFCDSLELKSLISICFNNFLLKYLVFVFLLWLEFWLVYLSLWPPQTWIDHRHRSLTWDNM